MKAQFIVWCLIVQICYGYTKMYTNYTLFRSIPYTEDHLDFLKNLKRNFTVDYWREPGMVHKPVDMLIAPQERKAFMRSMDEHRYYFTTVLEDVQSAFDRQTIKQYVRRRMETFDWQNYYKLPDIYSWIADLEKANPGVVEVINIGRTFENRDLLAVKVTHKDCAKRSSVIVEGGIHAREWIGISFVTYFMNQIVNYKRSRDDDLRKIALTYVFYFIPISNPDGYSFSIVEDRLWRKNRRDGTGVDINRNFNIAFGSEGVSDKPASEIYCGKKAFSELESEAMSNFIRSVHHLEYYLAFHSYGQYMILPYAHSKEHHANFDEVKKVLEEVQSSISRRYGTNYTIGTAFDTVGYMTSGVSGCWVKSQFSVPYVTTFELRDTGKYGFALPPDQILETCQETMDGIIQFLQPKTPVYKKLRQNVVPGAPGHQSEVFVDKVLIVFNICISIKYIFELYFPF